MIIGAHSIIYSEQPDADRAFFRDVLGLPSIDVGEGWLIFGLPPAEVAVHPSDRNDVHELYLMCSDIRALTAAMRKRGIECGEVEDRGWGLLTQLTLPGGGKLGIYQPRHARPKNVSVRKKTAVAAQKPARRKRASKARKGRPTAGRARR